MDFLAGLVRRGFGWACAHWQMLASLAVSALVFSAVVWAMPVAVPMLATMALAGFVSGATGAIVSDLLEQHTPTIKDVLLAATISTVLAAGSFGAASWISKAAPNLWKPVEWLLRPAISLVSRPAVTAVTDAVASAAQPLVTGAISALEASSGQAGAEIAKKVREPKPGPLAAPPPHETTTAPPAPPAPPAPSSSPGLLGALAGTEH